MRTWNAFINKNQKKKETKKKTNPDALQNLWFS